MYQMILVPIDGSPAATAGLDEAIRIAGHVGARLHLMNIVDDNAFAVGEDLPGNCGTAGGLRSLVRERGEKVLRRARESAESQGVITSTSLVGSGDERLQALVARQAEECGADLIVIGTHGRRGLSRVLISDDSGHLLNDVAVPVLLVRSEDVGPDLSVVEISASDSMFQTAP
jgi:nucleotide-binding universal stress UspA family protein